MVSAHTVWRAGSKALAKSGRRRADLASPTFVTDAPEWSDRPDRRLLSYAPTLPLTPDTPDRHTLAAACEHYLAHRFDLLGSGWVQVRHGRHCVGLEGERYPPGPSVQPDADGAWLHGRINAANLSECRRIWRLVDPDYQPIDWQLDFKSGYRWREDTWYRDIRYRSQRGADVKIPRELARMQHLPRLARAYAAACDGIAGFARPQRYAAEFRNQVLDFVATNPPRFGVNWECTMDVAIRIANWLLAYDMFRATQARFDAEFERVLARSVLEHGRHIFTNLEWHPAIHANHYLANVAGLVFVAAYLPSTQETDAWLTFAVRQLIGEAAHQFLPDGGNFEASTAYHHLCSEMVVFGTAVVLGMPAAKRALLLDKNRAGRFGAMHAAFDLGSPDGTDAAPECFGPAYRERLQRMAEFSMHLTKPDGAIPLIGDDDSGRFFKIAAPTIRRTVADAKARYSNLAGYDELPADAEFLDDEHTSFRFLSPAIDALFGAPAVDLEAQLVAGLCKAVRLQRPERAAPADAVARGDEHAWKTLRESLVNNTAITAKRFEIELPAPLTPLGLRRHAYPDFGIYVFKSDDFFLAVRCGRFNSAHTNGAHAHNDQLGIELHAGGRDLIRDRGSYIYLPLPERRDAFRSVRAHCAPRLRGREPASMAAGPFKLEDAARAQCLYFGALGFAGVHRGYGVPVYRFIELEARKVVVTDYCESPDLEVGDLGGGALPGFSPAYGVLVSTG